MTQFRMSSPMVSPVNSSQTSTKNNYFVGEIFNSFVEETHQKIVSFSQKINLVDPLAVLQASNLNDSLYFYWENPNKQEAIAALGATKKITIDSADRFVRANKFIKKTLQQVVKAGESSLPGCGPHFFCSFTFFPNNSDEEYPFPGATIFLPRWQIFKKNNSCILVQNIPVDDTENLKLFIAKLKQQTQEINWNFPKINNEENQNYSPEKHLQSASEEKFKLAVNSALQSIKKNNFSKIVIAHTLDVISPSPFHVINSLNNLRQRHPDCYIFSTNNGRGSHFIGASPERLISVQNQQLVTDALAGSAPRGKNISEDLKLANELLKNRKEKREHEAVSEFIIQRLRLLGLTPQKLPLQLLQLSNIQHLWTPIYAHLPRNINPLEIIAKLHPTPAVAGVPSKIACEQIKLYEDFDRCLYAAPLGWIDRHGNCEFIVGIRSALIENNCAKLYAGAGIVSGSDPDKEFGEIQLKLQSLLKALV